MRRSFDFSRRIIGQLGSGGVTSNPVGNSVAPAYNPMDESGGVMWLLASRDVATASASLSSSDPANAAWTKNDCTCVATGTGTQAQITVSAAPTDAYVTITPTNAATGALCVPFTVTFWVSYQDIPWVILETRAATANNQAAFNVQTGVIQSPALNMQDSTIAAETRNGVEGYRCSSTCWANGGAMIVRIHVSTAAAVTVPAAGTTMLIDDVTVSQVRVSAIDNFVSGTDFTPPSVDTQPGYSTDGGAPMVRHYGGQYAHSSEATLVARFTNTPACTYACLIQLQTTDANTAIFGFGLSSTATNHSGYFGQFTTNNGTWISVCRDATTAANVESTDVPTTAWVTLIAVHDGATETVYIDGVQVGTGTQNQATVSPDRVSVGSRPGSTPLIPLVGSWICHLMYSNAKDAAAIARIDSYLRGLAP